jgi:hypothetical protein
LIWDKLKTVGSWGKISECDQPANGFLLIPTYVWSDDKAHYRNAMLICKSTRVGIPTNFVCPNNEFMIGFRLRVQLVNSNDSAQDLYNVQMKCSNHTLLTGNYNKKGTWLSWNYCPSGEYITGLSQQIYRKNKRKYLMNLKFKCGKPTGKNKKIC